MKLYSSNDFTCNLLDFLFPLTSRDFRAHLRRQEEVASIEKVLNVDFTAQKIKNYMHFLVDCLFAFLRTVHCNNKYGRNLRIEGR